MSKDLSKIIAETKKELLKLLQNSPLGKRAINRALENRFSIKMINIALDELIRQKVVAYGADGTICLQNQAAATGPVREAGEKVWCKLQINLKYGIDGQVIATNAYAIAEDGKGADIKILDENLLYDDLYLLNGDRILVETVGTNSKGKPVGRIRELDLSSRPKHIHGMVGQYSDGEFFLQPVGNHSRLNFDVELSTKNSGGASAGSLARVKISQYPTISNPHLVAEMDCEFGDSNDPESFEKCFLSCYGLSLAFPDDAMAQIESISDPTEDEIKRLCEEEGFEDLRGLLTTTTDPDDAKDFDDASSIEKLVDKDGKTIYVLYQHIANVAHYALPNTPIFAEAAKRGTSVYLHKTVVPMFHPNLSNGVCSLNPNVDRLALTTILIFDEHGNSLESATLKSGKVLRPRMCQSIIHSAKRMTYSQNQQAIDKKPITLVDDEKTDRAIKDKIAKETALSRALDERRRERDCLTFDRPDKKAVFDKKSGKLCKIHKEPEEESHRVVENFALATNEYHAMIVNAFNEPSADEDAPFTIPYIHRFHDDPIPDKIAQTKQKLDALGVCSEILPDEVNPLFVQRLLGQTADKNVKDFLEVLVLRTLQRASYESALSGHFGLKLDNYAQVTSPIRRIGDTFNQVVDILLINMKVKTANGTKTFHDLVSYMIKTKNKTSPEIVKKRQQIREMVKKYLMAEFKRQYGINDVYAYAAELARTATQTELEAERAESEMLVRWCCFTMEDYLDNKDENGNDVYYNARIISVDGDRVDVEILDAPFTNFVGTLKTEGYEYKINLHDGTKNIIKVKLVTADKFNKILTFEENPTLRQKRKLASEDVYVPMTCAKAPQGKKSKKNQKGSGRD